MPAKGPRKYLKDVTVAFGLVTIVGDLYPLASKDKEDDFKLACPDCAAADPPVASRMTQGYQCSNDVDHGPYPNGECARGKQQGDEFVLVTKEEIEGVRTDAAEAEAAPRLQLSVHPSSQVDRRAWPTGNSYWFAPAKGAEQSYGLLADLAGERQGDDGLAFIGTMVMRKQEKLFRLTRAEFGLVIEEIYRPEQVHDFAMPDTDYRGNLLDVAIKLVDELKVDYDPETYKSKVGDRLAALMAAKGSGTPLEAVPSGPKADPADGLMAALQASLEAAGKAS